MESTSTYTTPMKTPMTRRRRALSPKVLDIPINVSPFDVVRLDLSTKEDLNATVLEQDKIIQELRSTNEDLQSKRESACLNESIIIESSNRIKISESRIHSRDINLLEQNLKSANEELIKLRQEINDEKENSRQQKENARNKGEKFKQLNDEIDSLKAREIVLQEKIRTQADQLVKLQSACENESKTSKGLRASLSEANRNLKQMAADIKEMKKENFESNATFKARRSMENILDEKTTNIFSEISTKITRMPSNAASATTPEISRTLNEIKTSQLRMMHDNKEKETLQRKYDDLKAKFTSASEDLASTKKLLAASEGDHDKTYMYIMKENDKVKQQKAELRCEMIQLKREHEKLKVRLDEAEGSVSDPSALTSLQEELARSLTERARLERECNESAEQLQKLNDSLAATQSTLSTVRDELDVATSDQREKQDMNREIERLTQRLKEATSALYEVDSQCEQYRDLVKRSDATRDRALKEVAEVNAKRMEMERRLDALRATESELAQLRAQKERLETKAAYLSEELQEAHNEYRNELASMAREISESKRRERDANDSRDDSRKAAELELQLKQQNNSAKSLERQVKELRDDNDKLQTQMSDVLQREKSAVSENARLLQGLSDAVTKIEKYKKESENARELSQTMAESLAQKEEKMNKMEDELCDMEDSLKEKEDLVGYLQSQVNVKQVPKVSRRSTLLSILSETESLNVSVIDPVVVEQLETEKAQLKRALEEKRRELEERREMMPPALPYHRAQPSAPPRTPLSSKNSSQSAGNVVTLRERSDSASMTIAPGTMRHDIPHKWRDMSGFRIFSIKCAVCFTGISTFGKARRCSHCDVTVHTQCAMRVVNTCGLPDQCANFYLEKHSAPIGKMNGWIKLFRDDTNARDWMAAWALMGDNEISFYDNESAQGDLSNPFLKVDLAREPFSVRAGSDVPSSADKPKHAGSIIHIKMPTRNLYLLTPSMPSAKRWTEALQAAQTRRIARSSKTSTFSEQHCLLALQSPNNLAIHTTSVIDDYLLIGAKSGLFFSPLSSSRMPSRIGGLNSVTAMEVLDDISMVALITGTQLSLALIPLANLKMELNKTQPAIRPDTMSGYEHLHLLMYHQQADGSRFLVVADTTKIHILKYNKSRDVFSAHHVLETSEPAMCLQSVSGGFYFGADSFYFVELGRGPIVARPLVPSHVADYPIAALPMDDDEVLLAYQNYGMFVNSRGQRTREKTVEWEQMPMEFVYTAPYLYIIHYDSIEIVEIAANTGSNSETVLNERRQMFTCKNAHIVGRRPNGDVYMSISNEDSSEVHRFNAANKGATMKRRGFSGSSIKDKRSKFYA